MFDILGVKYLTNNLQEIYYNINFLGTNAYQDLVKIIRYPEFKADQVPYSVTTSAPNRSVQFGKITNRTELDSTRTEELKNYLVIQ